MVQNNKVLTVSYGTFSCTLEGFEESFDTMKAIAEYFRDLAADDRYFGAEPPQPDAEMLAKIAQRDIARQVEAHTSTSGIHLRASENPPSETHNEPAVTVPDTSAPASVPTTMSPQTHSSTIPDTPIEMQGAGQSDIVQDIEPVVTSDPGIPDLDPETDEGSDAEAEIWGVEAALTDISAAQTNSDVIVPEPEDEPISAADSIAAKLMRIRSVVTKSSATEDDFNEDQHAESLSAQDAYREDTLRELEAMLSEEDQADDISADISHSQTSLADPIQEDDIAELVDQAVDSTLETEAAPLDETALSDATVADTTAKPAVSTLHKGEEKLDVADDVLPEPDTSTRDSAQTETTTETPAPPIRRGRVIRVRRKAELKDLINSTAKDVPETEPDSVPTSSQVSPAPESNKSLTPKISSSLSEEEEQDLIAELAAVEAELRAATQPDSSDVMDADGNEDAHDDFSLEAVNLDETRQTTETIDIKDPTKLGSDITILSENNTLDGDISRLMATADDKLDAADTVESRTTYNQLRAAVAAAQADDIFQSDHEDAKAQAYREDLAVVVRPRRPSKTKAQAVAKAKAEERPEPFQLVAAQRVDPPPSSSPKNEPTNEMIERRRAPRPVLPRRVPSDPTQGTSIPSESAVASFAEFALDQGATELGELLEAAAAYLVQIEGRAHFSRPQLLKTVRNLDEDSAPSREDSLRAFGQLLRKGKLDRAENGRFTINAQTAYSDRVAG